MFKENLKTKSDFVEKFLQSSLDNLSMPTGLKEAMYYSLLAGGKRLRPVLCISSANVFGLEYNKSIPFAAAIECIHSYSLIHDDLPAMDDDDFRRGKPSSHKQFDEATAILAGDALLTDAFLLMTQAATHSKIPAENVLKAIAALATAAGSSGMVGGQFLDMLLTAKKHGKLEDLTKMQAGKTGAMLSVSCFGGAILAGASESAIADLTQYGLHLGAAFQIVDDILDEIGDEALLGKPVGSDAQMGKLTFVSLLGLKESKNRAQLEADKALDCLEKLVKNSSKIIVNPEEIDFLRQVIKYVLKRAN